MTATDRDLHIAALLDLAVDELRRHGTLDVEEFARRYPDLTDELRPRLQTVVQVERGLGEPRTDAGATGATTGESAGSEEAAPFLAPAQGPGEIGRFAGYRVLREIGAGGMGVVFEAEEVALKRRVALKVMKPALTGSATARERFLREARATARVSHDHIVAIHAVGEHNGLPYLAMPLLNGQTLEERLDPRQGPLPLSEVLCIARQLATGLAAAHAAGLVHRDIKPSNLFLTVGCGEPEATVALDTTRSTLKIVDFGLARGTGGEEVGLTDSGVIVGTPQYMAPEQAMGQPVDHRCDLFSLGCVLYRMVTGEPPFKGRDTMSTLVSLAIDTPRPPHEVNRAVPRRLSAFILRLLSREPNDRPATARAVVEELRSIEQEVQQAPPQTQEKAVRPRRSWKWVAAAVACGLVGALAALAAPTVVRIATNKGELVLETAADDLEVTVWRDGVKVVDRATGRRFDLTAGDYEVEVREKPDGLRFYTKRFTLTRGGKEVVNVRLELAKVKTSPPPMEQPLPPVPPLAKGRVHPPASPIEHRLPPIQRGQPLSSLALVSQPAVLEGVRSWSIVSRQHWGPVYALAFHPKGRWIASGGLDGIVRLWEPDLKRLVRPFLGHTRVIDALAWSPDGRFLASGGEDATTRIWDSETGEMVRVLQPNEGFIRGLAWSPDGKTLAIACNSRATDVWDVLSGKLLHKLNGHTNGVWSVAWSPDGCTLASGAADETIRFWEAKSGKPLRTIPKVGGWAMALAWSPDGKTLASGGNGSPCMNLWDADTGRHLHTLQPPKPSDVRSIAWSPDGSTLLSGVGGTLHFWEPATGKLVRSLETGLQKVWAVAWFLDGASIVYAARYNTVIQIREAKSGQLMGSLEGLPTQLLYASWSPDVNVLATQGWDTRLWETRSGKLQRVLQPRQEGYAVAWSPDGKTLASGVGSGIRLWDMATDKPPRTLTGHKWDVCSLAWSPNGKILASGGVDQTVRLWNPDSGASQHTLEGLDYTVVALAWSPDSKTVAAGSNQDMLKVWSAETGKALQTLRDCLSAWSPNGKILATRGIMSGTVSLYESDSFLLLNTFPPRANRPDDLAFIDTLVWLPSGKIAEMVDLWTDDRFSSAFSADRRLLACGGPNTIWVWEMETGRRTATLVFLNRDQWMMINADGHYRGTPGVERDLVYVVQSDKGQETLTPEKFEQKYGWKNDPDKVKPLAK